MLSYKLDFSSCVIMPGFGKSSHILSMIQPRAQFYCSTTTIKLVNLLDIIFEWLKTNALVTSLDIS